MDSSLVSMVKELEQQAEQIIRQATSEATEEKEAAVEGTNSLIRRIRDEASEEAGRIQKESAAQLEKEIGEIF